MASLRGGDGVPGQGRSSGQRLQAAGVAASADDLPARGSRDVTDVAGAALGAAVQPSARDQAGADARADLEIDQVLLGAAQAGSQLAEGHEVDLVVHPDRRVIAGAEPAADVIAVPAGHDRRRDRAARRELDRPGDADADPPDGGATVRQGRDEPVEELLDPAKDRFRPRRDVARLLVVFHDLAVEIGQGDADAGGAELRREQQSRVGAEVNLARWPAAGRRAELAFSD